MKKAMCVLTLAILALPAWTLVGAEAEKAGKAEEKATASEVYVCPRHSGVRATWGCKCPHCGVALVQAEADVSHVRGCGCAWCARPVAKGASAGTAAKLLALKDEIGLSDEQVKRLQALAQKEEAKAQPPEATTPKVRRNTWSGGCRGCCGR